MVNVYLWEYFYDQYSIENLFMHTGIFISYTSAHYQPAQALVYWRKLVLKILPLLERRDT